jgi:hypothetical protein
MTSPGGGAGNEAAADAVVAAAIQALHKAMAAYPIGSKKYLSTVHAIRALAPNFAKQETQQMVPGAIAQMAQAARPGGGPMAAAPPPGLAPAPLPGGGGAPPGPPGGGGPMPPGGGEE